MKYLSPTALFGGILIPPLDKRAIQLGRKKLLAELELSGGDTVAINGTSYDKNEIINYFEELLSENALDYHHAVRADPALLTFLQDASIEPGDRFTRQAIYEDPAFIRWISPYFVQSFWQIIHASFINSDDLTTAALLNNPLLMTSIDQEKIWTDIGGLIEGEIDLLERYVNSSRRQVAKWRDTTMQTTTIADIMAYDHIRLLSRLPEGRFSEFRNKYAVAMMKASIVTFNRHQGKKDICETWMTNAVILAVSRELKLQIEDKLVEIKSIRKKKRPGRYAIIVFIIIATNLSRVFMGHSDSNNTIIRNAPTPFTNPPKDSLLRTLADSANHLNHPLLPPAPTPLNPSH